MTIIRPRNQTINWLVKNPIIKITFWSFIVIIFITFQSWIIITKINMTKTFFFVDETTKKLEISSLFDVGILIYFLYTLLIIHDYYVPIDSIVMIIIIQRLCLFMCRWICDNWMKKKWWWFQLIEWNINKLYTPQ